ncbi:MAG TPA: MBL fold metallo-hydrolase [Candidatus Dormibacteraeota bacterium]|nr:MBL fold metallo-hydrolase [Candidatus Dormibacteraeota bacterium]
MHWQEVGDRVFTRHFDFLDQQIGVVLGGDEVLVVDTRATPAHAREIANDLLELTRNPISIVVDTHWHWDHAFGNNAFRPAPIWGHVRTAERLRSEGDARRMELIQYLPDLTDDLRALVIDPPDHTFTDRATIEVGGRTVELAFHGRAHTDADISVSVPDAAVLFAGDLIENGAPPSFGDGYPMSWPAAVEQLLPLATGAVIPGHGAVGDRAFVESQLAAFRGLADLAREVRDGSLDMEAALAGSPFGPQTPRDAFDRALAELRGELA